MTQIRQRAIRTSDTKRDDLPAGATAETEASTIEDDANAFRSALRRATGLAKWYDALTAPSALEAGAARGIQNLNDALHLMEKKRFLLKVGIAANIEVGASANYVVLGAGELPSPPTAAVGAVTTRGTVVAPHGGTFGTHSLAVVAGDFLSPGNLVEVLDSATRAPVLSDGRTVWGLLQGESGLADGAAITATAGTRAQVSFVRQNSGGSAFEAVPAADVEGLTLWLSPRRRVKFEDLSEVAFSPGAVVTVGGGGGAGGDFIPLTATIRNVVDVTDGTEIEPGLYMFEVLDADRGNHLRIAGSENDKVVDLPGRFVPGTRLRIQYSSISFGPPPTDLVQLGTGAPDLETGTIAFVIGPNGGPYGGIPFGHTVDLMPAEVFDTGGPIYQVWNIVGGYPGAGGGGGGGGDIPAPSNATPEFPTPGGYAGTSDNYSRADHRHPPQDIPAPAIPPNIQGVVVGNAVLGDTLNNCDFLDPGDGTGIAAAVASLTYGKRTIWLRPGLYDFSLVTTPALPITLAHYVDPNLYAPPRVIMEALYRDTVRFKVGASRWIFSTAPFGGSFYDAQLDLVDVAFEFTDDGIAQTGQTVVGAPGGNGILSFTRVSAFLPYYNNAPSLTETLESFAEGSGIYLDNVYINATNYANGTAGGTEFVCLRTPNGAVTVKNNCQLLGGDQVIDGGYDVVVDDSLINGGVGTYPAVSTSFQFRAKRSKVQTAGDASCVRSLSADMEDSELVSATNTAAALHIYDRAAGNAVDLRRTKVDCNYSTGILIEGAGTSTAASLTLEDCEFTPTVRERIRGYFLNDDANPGVKDRIPMRGIKFSSDEPSYQAAAAGTLRGDNAGFVFHALIRMDTIPTDFEILFSNINQFQNLGGYYLAIDNEAFRFCVCQADLTRLPSGGNGLQSYSAFAGRLIGRTILVTLSYRDGIAYLMINGQAVQQITPVGGFGPADVSFVPYFGRNVNAGGPAYCTSPYILGGAYGGVHTRVDVENYYREVVRKNRLVDAPYLTDVWMPDLVQWATDPMVVKKGSNPLTLTGAQVTVELEPVW